MIEDKGGGKRFSFRVTAAATVTLEASDAAVARDALGGLLDGATAKVTTTGGEVELAELRIARDATLLLVDGVDPLHRLAEALRDFRRSVADSG